MAKVTYAELVKKVSAETGLSQVDVKKVIGTTFGAISAIVKAGDDVNLGIEIGTFKSTRTKDATKKVPGTDKTVLVEAKTKIKFQPSKAIKTFVEQK